MQAVDRLQLAARRAGRCWWVGDLMTLAVSSTGWCSGEQCRQEGGRVHSVEAKLGSSLPCWSIRLTSVRRPPARQRIGLAQVAGGAGDQLVEGAASTAGSVRLPGRDPECVDDSGLQRHLLQNFVAQCLQVKARGFVRPSRLADCVPHGSLMEHLSRLAHPGVVLGSSPDHARRIATAAFG